MRLRDIMTRQVLTTSTGTTLEAASRQMREHDIGALPVVDHGSLVGIVTDRDIAVRGFELGANLHHKVVGDIMTRTVVSCVEDQTVEEAVALMERKQIRRMPVLDRDNHLVGIVSLGDIAVDTGNRKLGGEALERISAKTGVHGISFKGILVPLDGSRLAEEILPYVTALATGLEAKVTLLRVMGPFEILPIATSITTEAMVAGIPTGASTVAVGQAEVAEDAIRYLDKVQKKFELKGIDVDVECQEGPSSESEGPRVATAIVDRARHLGVGLIAMTTHGRSGVGRALFGSVTDIVLREAPCPVMVIKAHHKPAQTG